MWGKSPNSSIQVRTPETTYIAEDCEFSGNLKSKGNVRIDGQIEGTVEVAGDLLIGPNATIRASIKAHTVSISGMVQGNIIGEEKIELTSSARLQGDIQTRILKIDQGAVFIGNSKPLDNPAKGQQESKLE